MFKNQKKKITIQDKYLNLYFITNLICSHNFINLDLIYFKILKQ
jgi:hypothetical protein